MKTIVIARHAKSDWATGLSDHDRPLNARGKLDAPRMGQALNELGFQPDLIISSSAVRARTTAEIVAKEHLYHQREGTRHSLGLSECGASASWAVHR